MHNALTQSSALVPVTVEEHMNLLIALALAGATGLPAEVNTGTSDWKLIVRAAHRMEVPSVALQAALRTTDRWPSKGTRTLCFDVSRIVPGSSRTVCHSLSEWRAYGLEPITD